MPWEFSELNAGVGGIIFLRTIYKIIYHGNNVIDMVKELSYSKNTRDNLVKKAIYDHIQRAYKVLLNSIFGETNLFIDNLRNTSISYFN